MKNENLANLSEEIRKIRYRTNYKINETARYSPLVGTNEEFDEVPKLTNEAGEQEDAPKPEGQVPPAPSNDLPQTDVGAPAPAGDTQAGTPAETPIPAFDQEGGEQPPVPESGDESIDSIGSPVKSDNQVNDIQNEIIKHNIEAMKSIHDQIESLSTTVQNLDTKFQALSSDVEEVREPTDSQKLMNKTNVSYPYYFNLNDFWQGNWFNQQREKESENGIKEMPDGSFVADFDDLPQKSKTDIQNSFNDTI